jgi:NTE family protein
VSGGSFTAAYFGLFGDRIFEDFESKFLKKNIQWELISRQFFYIPNWFRLASANFDSSDLAAEYYDKHIFEGGTFADIAARGGPGIFVNATDMTQGTWFTFVQNVFDLICSDVSSIPVGRATAASSAVPVVLSPISLRNYAGECNYSSGWIDEALEERTISPRRYYQAVNTAPYLDAGKKPFVHLVDGGVADNLGLRVAIDRIIQTGDAWSSLKYVGLENTHKVVFIVVNAETAVDTSPDLTESPASIFNVLKSISKTPLNRYNFETVELLRESFKSWTEEIQKGRCGDNPILTEPGSCGDIKFYLIEVEFDALKSEQESFYLKLLPTSFKLSSDEVDKLRESASNIINESSEYQRLLRDLK